MALKITFIATEIDALAKTGGLGDVAKALPIAMQKRGHDIRVICPFYQIMQKNNLLKDATSIKNINFTLDNKDYNFSVKQIVIQNVPIYLLDYPKYFDREDLYSTGYNAYSDNGERFSFFSLACLYFLKHINFKCDIIHINDWHTALVPSFLEYFFKNDPFFIDSKTVLTLHNASFQGEFSPKNLPDDFLEFENDSNKENKNHINFLKAGLVRADKIVAVSPTYAKELQTDLGSHNILDIFLRRKDSLSGILNGCSYTDWNPATDKYLSANYSHDSIVNKSKCKLDLQKYFHFESDLKTPMIGLVSRITQQKGIVLLLNILEELIKEDIQIIIVGTGDPVLIAKLKVFAANHPDKFHFEDIYRVEISHKLIAGLDYFLMPSLFEPCGLTQMYSLAYGTPPIVRSVGGLKDTVTAYNYLEEVNTANGFVFYNSCSTEFQNTIKKALDIYKNHPKKYREIQQNAMQTHFFWSIAAKQYEDIYLK